jgi:multiple sugar transport system ATP-binding protein
LNARRPFGRGGRRSAAQGPSAGPDLGIAPAASGRGHAVSFEHVTKRFPGGTVAVADLTLTVEEGEFLILVGPSGCGKTTALRMVAGLEQISDGVVRIGERVVNDLAPTERDIAMVFQNYALYPHMSVYDNIAFPLRQQGLPRRERDARVRETASVLGLGDLLRRRPSELSGGQRQRVAIGRALVRRPRAFLMDEPLSNLDAKLRVQMRAELQRLHQRLGITTVYVTHDQTEAMTLGDRVAVMDHGVVQQIDVPERLYREPANTFVAGFIGSPAMNFLDGCVEDGAVRIGSYSLPLPAQATPGKVLVGLRPEDFVAGHGGELLAYVEITEQLGPEVLVHFRVDGVAPAAVTDEPPQLLVARFDAGFHAHRGEELALGVRPERIRLFDPATGRSLTTAAGSDAAHGRG